MRNLIHRWLPQRIFKNSLLSVLDTAILSASGLFYLLFLARVLPKEQYGSLVLFDLVRNLLVLLIVAVGQATVKYVAERAGDRNVIVSSSAVLQSILLLACSLFVLVFRTEIARLLNAPMLATLLLWLPAILVMNTMYLLGSRVCWAMEEFHAVLLLDLLVSASLVLSILTLYAFGRLTQASSVMWAFLVSRAAGSVFALVLLRSRIQLVRPGMSWLIRLGKYSSSAFLNSAGVFGLSRADLLVLGLVLNPIAVATYNAGSFVFSVFMMVNETMNMVVFPRVSKIYGQAGTQSMEALRRLYVVSSLSFTALSLPLVVVLLIFPMQLSHLLYGSRFPEVPYLFMIFAVWGLTLPLVRVAATILNGIGKPHINAYMTWILATANLVLDWMLVSSMGVYGVAVGTLIVMALSIVCYLGAMHFYCGLRFTDLLNWRKVIGRAETGLDSNCLVTASKVGRVEKRLL